MIESPTLILDLIAGLILGTIFFGGLWWTVRKGIVSGQPAVWFLGSLLLRTLIALAGFYFVSRGDWRKLLACLLGFILSRLAVSRLTRVSVGNTSSIPQRGRT